MFAWSSASTRVLSNGVEASFPRTFKALGHGLPATHKLSEVFPSLRLDEHSHTARGRFGDLLKHGAGANAMLGPQIYAAGLSGMSKEDRGRLCNRLSKSGGVFMGFAATAVTEAVSLLATTDPGLAQSIVNGAENTRAMALAMIGFTVTKPIRRRIKNKLGEYVPELIKDPGMLITLGALATKLAAKRSMDKIPRMSSRSSVLALPPPSK